ncbi:MAG: sigma-70 family RNA polymerase sigma factor [Verrucomicrobiaceae bacterium]|nr:sigma-70 family RNA polymerase sigma factor [Verrucomicrobiaceae bacterium]
MMLDETDLIRKAQQGDLEAFARLVALHQKAVRACVAVRAGTPHDADDIAQEVFLVAHRKLRELDAGQPLGPWLRTVAIYLLRNHQRKIQRSPVSAVAQIADLADQALIEEPRDDLDEARMAAMHICLGKLESGARDLVRLRYEEDLPLAEIGARLNRKHSALTMALHRLRQSLRDCVEQQLSEAAATA